MAARGVAQRGFDLKSIRDFFRFLGDAWEELRKVTWLSRPQMIASTWLVVLLVVVFAVYVGVIDLIVTRVFAFII